MPYGFGVGEFTYPDPGMTAGLPQAAPAGYLTLRVSGRVGHGAEAFGAAADALLGWRMHRRVPLGVTATAERAAPGVRVTLRAGPLRAPCEVVWAVREPTRAGFAYGTLAGHPECGEEAFVLDLGPDGAVRFTVLAFSRPAAWYARAAGPLGRLAQHAAARRYIAALGACVRG